MSTDKKYLLAIDNGTQSVRALVFDLDGQLVAKSQVEIEPFFSDQPGWAEQHADYFWDRLCDACQQLWPRLDFPRTAIQAVALTTQRATVINLDAEGKPLRPAIIWLDQREQLQLPGMGAWGVVLGMAGATANVRSFRSQAEANWIAARQPDIWRRTAKFLLLSGYHSYRLTGRYVDSVASQVGYLPFDFRRQQWCGPRDWKWKALPIVRQQLPELVPAGAELGRITEQAARETGIPAGLALISAGADKACEVLGSGCLEPTVGSLSYGTTATYNTVDSRYLEMIRQVPAYPAAVPGLYNSETIVQRGYWMVNWFKREFGQPEQVLAARSGVKPEALFDDLLRQVPAGSMGLVLQPYWSPGLRIPGPEAKGAIIGFGDVHTRAHIYRAIIEGLAYALREGSERHERRSGHKIDRLKVSGGGSQSDQAMQITADIFGLAAERPHTFETSGLGAAINAAVATGLYPDYATAIGRMTHPGAVFTPIPANVQIYEQIYRQVYRKLYGRLGPLYKAIRSITGYPA
ncbi:MAG: FGGY-family carbohydrate kinase [Gammaproteobacteria bacterium]|jgi:sugar (pentulose or hexulose) kinase|nr:FGGY-family carbohydrate kinase [Gammaproteobacteria bacterium]MDH5173395.1 FGGY-family carbohydrate kinase [Gammaproteobacteria bacterium]